MAAFLQTLVALTLLLDPASAIGPPWFWHPHTVTVTKTITISTLSPTPFPPICHCPLETILTTTKIVPATCNCPLETILTTTLTQPPFCNATTIPGPVTGTAPSSYNATTSSTTPASSTSSCSLTALPSAFQIHNGRGAYLTLSPPSSRAVFGAQDTAATFGAFNASDGSITGIPQLAVMQRNPLNGAFVVEFAAYIDTANTTQQGGPVAFRMPGGNGEAPDGFGIVDTAFSTHECQLVLDTFLDHDLGVAKECAGVLWLGYEPVGKGTGSGCRDVKLEVVEVEL